MKRITVEFLADGDTGPSRRSAVMVDADGSVLIRSAGESSRGYCLRGRLFGPEASRRLWTLAEAALRASPYRADLP